MHLLRRSMPLEKMSRADEFRNRTFLILCRRGGSVLIFSSSAILGALEVDVAKGKLC